MHKDIRTLHENGQIFAVLPIADYEKLLHKAGEDSDEMLFDLAQSRNEESFPITLFDRIDNGESPVRVFREYRELSVSALATKAGISQAYLSQIENKKRQGSSKVLKKLAKGLGVAIDVLVE